MDMASCARSSRGSSGSRLLGAPSAAPRVEDKLRRLTLIELAPADRFRSGPSISRSRARSSARVAPLRAASRNQINPETTPDLLRGRRRRSSCAATPPPAGRWAGRSTSGPAPRRRHAQRIVANFFKLVETGEVVMEGGGLYRTCSTRTRPSDDGNFGYTGASRRCWSRATPACSSSCPPCPATGPRASRRPAHARRLRGRSLLGQGVLQKAHRSRRGGCGHRSTGRSSSAGARRAGAEPNPLFRRDDPGAAADRAGAKTLRRRCAPFTRTTSTARADDHRRRRPRRALTVPTLAATHWMLGALCAYCVGVARRGARLGIFVVPLMALTVATRGSRRAGCCRCCARRRVRGRLLSPPRADAAPGSLAPWVVVGMVAGRSRSRARAVLRAGGRVIVLAMIACTWRPARVAKAVAAARPRARECRCLWHHGGISPPWSRAAARS